MATTPFSILYPFIRTLLGDIFTIPSYSNDQLDMGIRQALLFEDPCFAEVTLINPEGDQEITPAIVNASDKLRVCVRSAIALLRPSSDAGSYRTPMLSVSTTVSISYTDLKSLLRELTDGGLNIVASDNEFDQAFNGITTVPALLNRFGVTSSILANWGNQQISFPNN